MSNAYLVPKAGALVRDPATFQPLADDGEWKSLDQFWRRRLRDGDVIDATKAARSAAKAAAKVAGSAPAAKPRRKRRSK